MRIYFLNEIRQIQCMRTEFLMRPMPECIGQASNSGKCIGFVLFHKQK